MTKKELLIPAGTVITAKNNEGEKVIPMEFINLLPENVRGNIESVLNIASSALGHDKSFLRKFNLGTEEQVSSILGVAKNDLILKI